MWITSVNMDNVILWNGIGSILSGLPDQFDKQWEALSTLLNKNIRDGGINIQFYLNDAWIWNVGCKVLLHADIKKSRNTKIQSKPALSFLSLIFAMFKTRVTIYACIPVVWNSVVDLSPDVKLTKLKKKTKRLRNINLFSFDKKYSYDKENACLSVTNKNNHTCR